MTKRIEQLMRRAEGALGRAFQQLDAAGSIARKLDAETLKQGVDRNFVELLIVREVVDRVGRICNAAFIADARAAGPLPFPPRDMAAGVIPGARIGTRQSPAGKISRGKRKRS
ncbi:MAG: hypothetical protein ABSG38_16770 [Spirochaetia bacterium]|jgi:hypothetical protein